MIELNSQSSGAKDKTEYSDSPSVFCHPSFVFWKLKHMTK